MIYLKNILEPITTITSVRFLPTKDFVFPPREKQYEVTAGAWSCQLWKDRPDRS